MRWANGAIRNVAGRSTPVEHWVTGQSFSDVRQLKRILVEDHRQDFYRCLTENLLVFAIGRPLEYYDVQTVDAIVEQLEANGGRPSVLLTGIVESSPFQKAVGDGSWKIRFPKRIATLWPHFPKVKPKQRRAPADGSSCAVWAEASHCRRWPRCHR